MIRCRCMWCAAVLYLLLCKEKDIYCISVAVQKMTQTVSQHCMGCCDLPLWLLSLLPVLGHIVDQR